MTLLETIIYSFIFGSLLFLFTYWSVRRSANREKRKIKTYKFEEPAICNLKDKVDSSQLSVSDGSGIDGAKAVDSFCDK